MENDSNDPIWEINDQTVFENCLKTLRAQIDDGTYGSPNAMYPPEIEASMQEQINHIVDDNPAIHQFVVQQQ